MAITVKKVADDLYTVSATPPDVEEVWSPAVPLHGRQLTRELIKRGCHQQDVGDAMYEQDSLWIEKLRGPDIPSTESK